MYAVYFVGCTDCFLQAMFRDRSDAETWGEENSKKCDGFTVEFWKSPEEIDRTDTGWEN